MGPEDSSVEYILAQGVKDNALKETNYICTHSQIKHPIPYKSFTKSNGGCRTECNHTETVW